MSDAGPVLGATSYTTQLTRLMALLEQRTGIAAGPRFSALPKAERAFPDPDRLAAEPDDSPEWQWLIDRALVAETYLFRNAEQLALAAETALTPQSLDALQSGPVRVWSAGCCTGEEAYSLAIVAVQALIAAGHGVETAGRCHLTQPWSVDVLGTDISGTALMKAKRAIYGMGPLSSFRSTPRPMLRFFPRVADQHHCVRADIRAMVRFCREGLLGSLQPPITGCQIVACRNVLPYLTLPARQKALSHLSAAVKPGGVLLLGPADPRPNPAHFSSVWGHGALIYRRNGVS